MAKIDVTLRLDAALVQRAKLNGGDISAVVEAALRRQLDRKADDAAADRRWAEDNALAVEAMATGADGS